MKARKAPTVAQRILTAKVAVGEPITTENYGRVADSLRRDLRVAQVACLKA